MPNPNIYSQIDQDAPNRLAQVFDPVAIGERQLAQARTARGNRLQELVGSMNGADPAQAAQMLGREGFIDEAAKYQGLADVAQQRRDQEVKRRQDMTRSAFGQIAAEGGSGDAVRKHLSTLPWMPADQVNAAAAAADAMPEDQRQPHFFGLADPNYLMKRQEAEAARVERGEQAAAQREERARIEQARIEEQRRAREENNAFRREITREQIAGRAENAKLIAGAVKPVKLTEDQSKATGWLAQADNAYANMQAAMKEDTEAISPSWKEALASKVSPDAANLTRSPARQKFMHGVESFSEAALRAATGAGVNKDEAAQKVRELTPTWTDSKELAQQKLNGLKVYMDSFKVRAGPGVASVQMRSEEPPPTKAAQQPAKPAGKGPSVSNW